MSRPRPLLYQVRKAETPYQGKSWKVTAYIDGKRKQHWFTSEREAKTFANDSNAELQAYGSQLADLSAGERADGQRALTLLKGHDVSLLELAKAYVAQAAARAASKPLDQFLVEYEASIARRVESGELRNGSLKAIKETFVKLEAEFVALPSVSKRAFGRCGVLLLAQACEHRRGRGLILPISK